MLEEININLDNSYIYITSNNVNKMKSFLDNSSKFIKTLKVTLYKLSAVELKTCIECIARFENLKELKLKFDEMNITQPIDDCLSLIGQKCNKLLKLDLYIDSHFPISHRLLTNDESCFQGKGVSPIFFRKKPKVSGPSIGYAWLGNLVKNRLNVGGLGSVRFSSSAK